MRKAGKAFKGVGADRAALEPFKSEKPRRLLREWARIAQHSNPLNQKSREGF
jgi:hypothetical protein